MDCQRTVNNNIDSVPPSAICIEVGPLAHGTLNNPPLLDGTRHAVRESLQFIDKFNKRDLENIENGTGNTEVKTISGFRLWKPIYFPKTPNACTIRATLHPNLIGKDFQKLSKGDPMFVDLATSQVVEVYEEEESAYPCFIGEAAYFASGIAMWLCKEEEFPLIG